MLRRDDDYAYKLDYDGYNKGNDCDNCQNEYICGEFGDAIGCRCADEGKECNFVPVEWDN